jgi:hypothetical protein
MPTSIESDRSIFGLVEQGEPNKKKKTQLLKIRSQEASFW